MTFYNYIENAKGKVADIVNDWTQEGANTKAYVNDNLDGARREYMQLADENAKLRELAKAVNEFLEDVECGQCPMRRDCEDNNRVMCDGLSYHALCDIRELGVMCE